MKRLLKIFARGRQDLAWLERERKSYEDLIQRGPGILPAGLGVAVQLGSSLRLAVDVHGPGMDLEWIWNGPEMGLEWIWNGSGMDLDWIRNGPGMDLEQEAAEPVSGSAAWAARR